MKITTHKCYNEKAQIEVKPIEFIQAQFGTMEPVLKYLYEFKPDIYDDYIKHLVKRIKGALKTIKKKKGFYDFPAVEKEYDFLDKHSELKKVSREFLLAHMNPLMKSKDDSEKYLVCGYNHSMAFRRISYHRVKSLAEMLGKEEGLELYSKIIRKIVEVVRKKNLQTGDVTIAETRDNQIKAWCEYGMADFVCCEFDEHKIHYRFDSCFAHEVLKDFNDPDVAYYASCYAADVPEWNNDRIIHMRRAITLHHGDFCDELYWDSRKYDNPEQPSLDFTRSLGKEKK